MGREQGEGRDGLAASQAIPEKCDVVVMGGGPAGSAAATLLAQRGYDVVLFEKDKFPRPQVGESVLPHVWKFLDRLGVTEKIRQERFLAKSGGIIAWDGKIHQIRFTSFGYTDLERLGLHVERDIFDDILLRHAEASGARVFEEVAARQVDFSDPQWPLVAYTDRRGRSSYQGTIAGRYVVDASGYAAVLARQFNSRQLVGSEANKFLGLWGYYKDSRYLGVDGKSHDPASMYDVKPVTFIRSFEEGWIWHIILRESTSVGMVVHTDRMRGMGKTAQARYLDETCRRLPILGKLLEPATLIEGSMFFRPDYSYYSKIITGENFYCIGDAGGFVDPIFSQGVQAALYNATICSWAIAASFENEGRRQTYSTMAEQQMSQYYGFSRLLALGDFGAAGVDEALVNRMIRLMPAEELELAVAAAMTTSRSGNLYRMAEEAGIFHQFGENFGRRKLAVLDRVSV